MAYVTLERDRDDLLVNGVVYEWPARLVEVAGDLIAGMAGEWMRRSRLASSDGRQPEVTDADRRRTFCAEVDEKVVRHIVSGVPTNEIVFVECRGDAALLPIEAAGSGESARVNHAGQHSLVRVIREPSDAAIWERDRPPAVTVLDTTRDKTYVQEYRPGIEAFCNAYAAQSSFLSVATADECRSALSGIRADILHLVAHGSPDYLSIGNDDIPITELAPLVAKTHARLVVLSVCHSAAPTHHETNLAHALLIAGVPAVIAAREEISADAMAAFVEGLYESLAAGHTVVQAVRHGRNSMGSQSHNTMQQAGLMFFSNTRNLDGIPPNPHVAAALKNMLADRRRSRSTLPFIPLQPVEVNVESPTSLLTPHARIVPFVGASSHLSKLTSWRDKGVDQGQVTVAAIVGEGGRGKTRLATEFVEHSNLNGWTAGLLSVPRHDRGWPTIQRLLDNTDERLLIAIDYAEASVPFVAELIEWLVNERVSEANGKPVRVALIVRTRPANRDWLSPFREEAPAHLERVFEAATIVDLDTEEIDETAKVELYDASVSAFSVVTGRPQPTGNPSKVGGLTTPLEIAAAALVSVLGDDARPPFESVLTHERRYWRRHQPQELSRSDLETAVAVATLAGLRDEDSLRALMKTVAKLSRPAKSARWLFQVAPSGTPLVISRIAELQLVEAVKGKPKWLRNVLNDAEPAVRNHGLSVLARASTSAGLPTGVAEVLGDLWPSLVKHASEHSESGQHLRILAEQITPVPVDQALLGANAVRGNPHHEARHACVAASQMLHRSCDKWFGPKAPKTLGAQNDLAMALAAFGELSEAHRVSEDCYEKLLATFGNENPATLLSLNNLASILEAERDLPEAHRRYQTCYRTRVDTLGEDHPSTLLSLNNLASILETRGQLQEAHRLYQQCYEQRVRVLGKTHSDSLVSLNNLAHILAFRGELRAARKLYEESYALHSMIPNETDGHALDALNNLAHVLYELGDLRAARNCYEESHRRHRNLLGDQHPNTMVALLGLCSLNRELGDVAQLKQVEPQFEEVYKRSVEEFGLTHPQTLVALTNLASFRVLTDELNEARTLFEESYRLYELMFGAQHPDTLHAGNKLGLTLQKVGDSEAALIRLEDSYMQHQRVFGPNHPDTLTALNSLVGVLASTETDRARSFAEASHKRHARVLGDDHPSTLTALNNFASVLQLAGESGRAQTLFEESYERHLRVLGSEHPATLNALHKLRPD